MTWISREMHHVLRNGWTLEVAGTLALGISSCERDAIFQASPSVLSALSIEVGTLGAHFSLWQPLRAGSGTGAFGVETG